MCPLKHVWLAIIWSWQNMVYHNKSIRHNQLMFYDNGWQQQKWLLANYWSLDTANKHLLAKNRSCHGWDHSIITMCHASLHTSYASQGSEPAYCAVKTGSTQCELLKCFMQFYTAALNVFPGEIWVGWFTNQPEYVRWCKDTVSR